MQPCPAQSFMPGPIDNQQLPFYPNGGPFPGPPGPMDQFCGGMPMMMPTPAGPCFVTAVPMVPPGQSGMPMVENPALDQQQPIVPPNPPSAAPAPAVLPPRPAPAIASDVNYSPKTMSISSGGSANTGNFSVEQY